MYSELLLRLGTSKEKISRKHTPQIVFQELIDFNLRTDDIRLLRERSNAKLRVGVSINQVKGVWNIIVKKRKSSTSCSQYFILC